MKKRAALGAIVYSILVLTSCAEEEKNEESNYLYAISGSCFVGNLTSSSDAKTIVRYKLTTGVVDRTIADFNSLPGDIPVAGLDLNKDDLLVAVENAVGRRLEVIRKKDGQRATATLFPTGGALRDISIGKDGYFFIPRLTTIEKYSASMSRVVTTGTTAWVTGPGGSCATSTTGMRRVIELGNGNLLYMHSANTGTQQRLGIVSANGYRALADCLGAQAAPSATQIPTAMLYLPDAQSAGVGHLLVTYASSTIGQNEVLMHVVDEAASTIAAPVSVFQDSSVIYGPSAMVMDPKTGDIYIANGSTTFQNSIWKFKYSPQDKKLNLQGNVPFASETINSRCINSMFFGS